MVKNYFGKMRGGGNSPPQPIHWRQALCSWIGSFLSIALIGWLAGQRGLSGSDQLFLIGSFGATAVLLYGSPAAPFSQPGHVLGGHFLSALVGITVYRLLPDPLWLSAALAVSLAVPVMYLTHTTHPPGGATALIAVIGGEPVHGLGYGYVLFPVMEGIFIMLFIALLINNLSPQRRYPNYWFARPRRNAVLTKQEISTVSA
ncbi:MAG: HPP family protein [Thiothrix sp.]|nr:HPP family protein [Thiothrix sp.]HPQ94257.1 HPP family protein [Thiolinea sp.]